MGINMYLKPLWLTWKAIW